MSAKICKGCGRPTNTATSNWLDNADFEPTECYVAWEDGKPVKGCAYHRADRYQKHFADTIIGDKAYEYDTQAPIDRLVRMIEDGQKGDG